MNLVAPLGPVYQAGTLSGNPLAMRAGIETLKQVAEPNFYERLNERAERLVAGLRKAAKESGLPAQLNAKGSLATLFFTERAVRNYEDAKVSDTGRYARFFQEMLGRGIFLAPSQFEAMFLSAAHTDADIDGTISAARECLRAIAASA
jgi:glutamate-1-semialdehyde 2,1-aminomutase